jgi:hypothetical protein
VPEIVDPAQRLDPGRALRDGQAACDLLQLQEAVHR